MSEQDLVLNADNFNKNIGENQQKSDTWDPPNISYDTVVWNTKAGNLSLHKYVNFNGIAGVGGGIPLHLTSTQQDPALYFLSRRPVRHYNGKE